MCLVLAVLRASVKWPMRPQYSELQTLLTCTLYLSLSFLAGGAVWPKQVFPVEVPLSQLSGSEVAKVTVFSGDSPECLDLLPAHEVLSTATLRQEHLQ